MAIRERAVTDVEVNGQDAATVLTQLEKKAQDYKKAMVEANKANDLNGYKKAEAELKKTERTMTQLKKATFDVNTVMKNLSTTTLNDLTRAQRQLQAELNKTTRGTAEYIAKSKQLAQISGEIRKVRVEMGGAAGAQQGFFSKMSGGFNKYFGMITAAAASLTGIVFGVRKSIDAFNTFEKGLSNLSALTGLQGESLKWLGEQAKTLSTTTTDSGVKITSSATEILEAYKLMGSAKPELLENKEALNEVTKQALILKEAAGMETAPAITALANIMNQFGAGASDAANYANVLAAGAKAGAAEIEDLSDSIIRSGAAATSANVTIEEEVALIETLAEKGIKAERAGTGLRGTILKLQKGSDEFNPKIVGMSKALENLAEKNMTAKEMIALFGEENYTVAQILVNNRERFDDLTVAVTGTNEAVAQAIINTDNNAASLEQAKNRAQLMSIELGQKLAPALTFSTNSFSYLLKAMLAAISLFKNHGKTILSVTAGIIAYTIALKAKVIWTNIVTGATWLAQKAMLVFNTTMKANPIAIIVGLLAAVATALALFRKRTEQSTKSQNDFNEAVARGNELLANSKSIEERMDLLKTFNIRQMELLKSDINKQLEAEEDFTTKLLTILKKRFDEDEHLNKLKTDLAKARNDMQRAWLSTQVRNRERELAADLQAEHNKHKKSVANLKSYLTEVSNAIKSYKVNGKDPLEPDFETLEKSLEDYFKQKRLAIHKDYLTGKTDKEQFDANLEVLEVAHLEAQLAMRKKYGQDTYDIELKLTQKLISLMERVKNANQATLDQMIKDNEVANDKILEDGIKSAYEAIDAEFAAYEKETEDKEKQRAENIAAQIQELEQYKQMTEQFASSMGAAIGQMMTDAEMSQKEFAKMLVMTFLDMTHNIVRMAVAQIWAQAMASVESGLTWGAAGVYKAMALTAIVEAAFAGVKAAVSQMATGSYNVIGADDGRSYNNVPFKGEMKTGEYTRPTLVAEHGTELVVDAGTLRNVKMNYPDVISKIRASRVTQHASGNVGAATSSTPAASDSELKELIKQNTYVMAMLHAQVKNGIQANMSYEHWKTQTEKAQAIEASTSRT